MDTSEHVFKSMCEDILKCSGVKVGGYNEDIFDKLSDAKKEELICQICFMMVKDPHTCSNKHLFCATCIYAWAMTSDDNKDRCPVCRVHGAYCEDSTLSSSMKSMAVSCLKCKWKGQLSDYRSHPHGLEDAGLEPRLASLPGIWTTKGEVIFPDLLNEEEDVFARLAKQEKQLLKKRLEIIEARARLNQLINFFDEDVRSHRDNLNLMTELDAHFDGEELSELFRMERELCAVTSNLLDQIEAAGRNLESLIQQLRLLSSDVPPYSTPHIHVMEEAIDSIRVSAESLGQTAVPTISQPGNTSHELSSRDIDIQTRERPVDLTRTSSSHTGRLRGHVEEPREPVRRARFFQARPRIPDRTRQFSSSVGSHRALLPRREQTESNTLSTQERIDNTPANTVNPLATTHLSSETTLETNLLRSNLPAVRESSTSVSSLAQSVTRVPRPPNVPQVGATRNNPYTITWPPSPASSRTAATPMSRQALRRMNS
ncbi:uncharacterized protein [Watersipora subatra]|uniref:uncharacterized protein n=1 Tax=Watersipora subatra TaxID=2589382 RepID=UPI00355C89FE